MAGEEAYDLKNAEAEVQTAAGSAAELRVASALRCAGIVLPQTQPPRPTPAVAERAALVAAERCFRAVASLSPTRICTGGVQVTKSLELVTPMRWKGQVVG